MSVNVIVEVLQGRDEKKVRKKWQFQFTTKYIKAEQIQESKV